MNEREHAVMQGEQCAATEAYIDARPQLDSINNRRIFEAGFERGWRANTSAIETMRQRVRELEKELGECQVHFFVYDKLSDELTAERALSDKLDKALLPFVRLLQPHNDNRYSGSDQTPLFAVNDAQITLGDLRLARAVIAELAAMRKRETE